VAPRLVLLHALGASGGAWAGVTARLGRRYACVAPDLPGFGAEPALSGGVAATLDWLTAEIARLSPAAYLLVGHSMGGKFATLLAARAEAGELGLAGLKGVVLLAGSPPSPEPMNEVRRAEMVRWFASGAPSDADARRFVAANIAHQLSVEFEAEAIADMRRSHPAAWIDWLERGAREDWSGRVGRLSTPALIVAGAEDGDLGELNQRRLNVPHFTSPRVTIVPRAVHLLPYEQPEAIANLIDEAARAWLPEPPPTSARSPSAA
jgi:pimeloyl-ACP methyl ester carboxylesterase